MNSRKCRDGCSSSLENSAHKHRVQLQITDGNGVPISDTEFWVKVTIYKVGHQVTIHLPLINFVISDMTAPDNPNQPNPMGGFVTTSKCFLDKEFRPSDLIYPSTVVASNSGLSQPFSYNNPTFPSPPVGYILSITNAGAISIQCAGTFKNVIPIGPQIMPPSSLTYLVGKQKSLCQNFRINAGPIDITQFTKFPAALSNGYQDMHVNDAYDGIVAWSWIDNSMIEDKTNGVTNSMVRMGHQQVDGSITMGPIVQLTDSILLASGSRPAIAWNTSAAINRRDTSNIVVSYSITVAQYSFPCRAVSTDGGATWPIPYRLVFGQGYIEGDVLNITTFIEGSAPFAVGQYINVYYWEENGPDIVPGTMIIGLISGTGSAGSYQLNFAQTGRIPTQSASHPYTNIYATYEYNGPLREMPPYSVGFGDNPGVSADYYGNIWYITTYHQDRPQFSHYQTNAPLFFASAGNGTSYELVYQVQFPDPDIFPVGTWSFESPVICFGNDNSGQYGLWFTYKFVDERSDLADAWPAVGFIPIFDHGKWGTGSQIQDTWLQRLNNSIMPMSITAGIDGRVWFLGEQSIDYSFSGNYVTPVMMMAKSPGPIEENYSGVWDCGMYTSTQFDDPQDPPIGTISQPVYGYFTCPRSIIYDICRKALYAMAAYRSPNWSQDMRIFFIVSRDNGQTWSRAFDVNSSNHGNRGFPTMALDIKTLNLIFGWFDGRNDPTYHSVEYYSAIIHAKTLDKLVNQIPLANPVYNTGSFANPINPPTPIGPNSPISPNSLNSQGAIPSNISSDISSDKVELQNQANSNARLRRRQNRKVQPLSNDAGNVE